MKYSRKGIYNSQNHITLQKVKNINILCLQLLIWRYYGGPNLQTQQTILETQHNIFGTQVSFVKHDTKLSKHNTKLSKHNTKLPKHNTKLSKHNTKLSKQNTKLPKHNTKLPKQHKILADHSGKPRYEGMKTRRVSKMAVEMVMVCPDVSDICK